MKPTDIKLILDNFINNSTYKSILIDGKWGCGKTYEVTSFLSLHPELNVAYVSMFGIESIDELNTCIYEQTHHLKRKIITTGKVVSKIVQMIPKLGEPISDFINSGLSVYENYKNNDYVLVIIDDLERKSSNISYTNLFGYINNLFSSHCRILCLVNSYEINLDNDKKEYISFREKVFNDYFEITQRNDLALKNILGDTIQQNNQYFELFSDNLREAEKSKYLFDRVTNLLKEKNKTVEDIGFDNNSLIAACFVAIKISFLNYETITVDDSSYSHKLLIEEYGDKIGRGIIYEKKELNAKFNLIESFWDLVVACCNYYMYLDEGKFMSFFVTSKEEEDSFLNKEFYFLSDANKDQFCEIFRQKCCEGKLEYNRAFERSLACVVCHQDFTNDEILMQAVFDVYNKNKNLDKLRDLQFLVSEIGEDKEKKFGSQFSNAINNFLVNFEKVQEQAELEDAFNSKNYGKMKDILYNKVNKSEDKKEFNKMLEDHDYFLPDLNGDITYDQWSYSHELADYIKKCGDVDKFISFSKSMCRKDQNNKSLIDRFYALIFYKIDDSFTKDKLLKD